MCFWTAYTKRSQYWRHQSPICITPPSIKFLLIGFCSILHPSYLVKPLPGILELQSLHVKQSFPNPIRRVLVPVACNWPIVSFKERKIFAYCRHFKLVKDQLARQHKILVNIFYSLLCSGSGPDTCCILKGPCRLIDVFPVKIRRW